ncbi:MAG: PAS domain S-box protein [Desulfomonile tiedjei]|uniref:histidine kinase n=1 Tax=Desulfomonile tiedjei TaxID=2358 RepID=A0A9D6Z5M1_9BACT|nr:PAS domain S-box protein [Desulfomonile tiedjei]
MVMKFDSGPESKARSCVQGTAQSGLENAAPIKSWQPGWIVNTLGKIENFLPEPLKPKRGILLSFKNRILLSTLLILIGVVVIIGVTLQITVFPKLGGDPVAIRYLKIIHFLASVVVIAISWVFIELISKRIARPLTDLTRRADQISREAGASTLVSNGEVRTQQFEDENNAAMGDEIYQLTSSFNRMLVHLKASESRLRDSEEKYRFLFDNGPSPIFVIDSETAMILDVNARAGEEYQFTREELLNMSFADLGLDRDRAKTVSRLQQLFSTEVTLLPVAQHRRRDGSLFMVNYQASPVRYRNRPAVIAAVWDVTERLEKHAMVIQAGKMATLGEMATGIAHELNQPLNVIRLGCDYMNKIVKTGRTLSTDDMENITKELTSSVERASRIINHLRQFGRKADGMMVPTDINAPVRNVFALLGTQLQANGILWELNLAENLPHIVGDANRLEQVFINLILNAKDAILSRDTEFHENESQEKLIRVKSYLDHKRIVVTVTDTGPGIREQLKERIFEPFFTTKKMGEGTGLGLSISYGIIKEHQGIIEIDPHQQKGATFRMTFPLPKAESRNDENPAGR